MTELETSLTLREQSSVTTMQDEASIWATGAFAAFMLIPTLTARPLFKNPMRSSPALKQV